MAKKSYILKEIRSSNSIYNKYHNLQNTDKNILFFYISAFIFIIMQIKIN